MPRNENCVKCPLHIGVKNVCIFGYGQHQAEIFLVGEAPGDTEDDTASPFIGRAGKLLNDCLKEAGLERSDVYTTNIIKCRPHSFHCYSCNNTVTASCGESYCNLAPALWNRPPTTSEIKACGSYLQEEIETLKPKVIVCLGNTALSYFTGKKAITRARGKLLESKKSVNIGDALLMATVHPSYALRPYGGAQAKSDIIADLAMAAQLVGKNVTKLPEHEYQILLPGYTESTLQSEFDKFNDIPYVALDLEWTAASGDGTMTWPWSKGASLLSCSLSGYTDLTKEKIISVSFAWRDFCKEPVAKFITEHKIGGHNLISDCIYLRSQGIKFIPGYDTMAEEYHLNEESPRSLEVLTTKKAKIPPLYKHTQFLCKEVPADNDTEKWTILLTRGANDTYGTAILHECQKEEINNLDNDYDQLVQHYQESLYDWERKAIAGSRRRQTLSLYHKVTLPRIKYAAEMSWRGAPVDRKAMKQNITEQEQKLIEVVDDLARDLAKEQTLAQATKLRLQGAISTEDYHYVERTGLQPLPRYQMQTFLNSPKRLLKTLNGYLIANGEDFRLDGTGKEVLSLHQDTYPAFEHIRDYRHIRNKILGTYLRPWDQMLEEQQNNFLHCVFSLWTSTGRAAARSEVGGSLHQMPREPWMRRVIRAPKGCKLISCDNSMIEMRMAAWLANEEHMIQMFRDGIDLHAATAGYVSIALPRYKMSMQEFWPRLDEFIPLVTKEQRDRAKPVNFGLLFGQQPLGFIEYARTNYGIKFSRQEAELAHSGYFKLYPGLLDYFDQAQRWYRRGWCITPFGRVRHNFLLPTEAINMPIQSSASELLGLGSLASQSELEETKAKAIVFAEIHDSMLAFVANSEVDSVGAIIKKHMERPPTEWLGVPFNDIPVPLKADLTISDYWGQSYCKDCGNEIGSWVQDKERCKCKN